MEQCCVTVNCLKRQVKLRQFRLKHWEHDVSAFERAAEIVAQRLASFRLGLDSEKPFAFNKHEKLCAGHIVGSLWAKGLLNVGDEVWVTVETETSALLPHDGKVE